MTGGEFDVAASAYEAISSQLAEWGGGGDDDGNAGLGGTNDFTMTPLDLPIVPTTTMGGGGEDNTGYNMVINERESFGSSAMVVVEDERKIATDALIRFGGNTKDTYSKPTTDLTFSPQKEGASSPFLSDVGNADTNFVATTSISKQAREYQVNKEYHDTFCHFLVQRKTLKSKLGLLSQQNRLDSGLLLTEEDGEEMPMEEEEEQEGTEVKQERVKLHEEFARIQLELFHGLRTICRSRMDYNHSNLGITINSNDQDKYTTEEKECNFWHLLHALFLSGGTESLLFDSDKSFNYETLNWGVLNNMDINSYPAQLISKLLDPTSHKNDNTASATKEDVLQRRHQITQSLEQSHKRHTIYHNTLLLPPKDRDTMWKQTLSPVYQHLSPIPANESLDPDAPLKKRVKLHKADEEDDATLLQAVLSCMQSGNMDQALNLCREAGQHWRAGSLLGGELHDVIFEEDEEQDGGVILTKRQIGNPNRSLWKKQCQQLAYKLYTQYSNEGLVREKHQNLNGFVYESAIYSILSNDLVLAIKNPALSSWESHVWLYFKGLVEHATDEVLAIQTQKRRAVGKRLPYPGCTLDTTTAVSPSLNMKLLTEVSIFDNLSGASPYTPPNIQQDSSDPYRIAMASFIMGKDYIRDYLVTYIYPRVKLSHTSEYENVDDVDVLSNDMLRFITHVILYLTLSANDDQEQLPLILPTNEMLDIITAYIQSLIQQRHLPLVAMYTSLLHNTLLVDTYTSFLVGLENEEERRLTLNLARDYFEAGLDLVILRKVARVILHDSHEDTNIVRVGRKEHDSVLISVKQSDLRKLLSVQWFLYYPEHRLEGLIATNSLLRQFLLYSNSKAGEDENLLLGNGMCGEKLSAAKLLVVRFFPDNSIDVITEWLNVQAHQLEQEEDEEQLQHHLQIEHTSQEAILEYNAITTYLEAHTAYEEWRRIISMCQVNQPKRPNFSQKEEQQQKWNEVEEQIARDASRRKYKSQKMSLARTVIRAAQCADEKLRLVLEFEGGWLDEATETPEEKDGMVDEQQEEKQRRSQMKSLRSSCLPHVIFMLYSVLDGMASHISEFYNDDEYYLNGQRDETDSLLFEESYWHRNAMGLAAIMAKDEYNLTTDNDGVFTDEELKRFLNFMAESAVKLLSCHKSVSLTDSGVVDEEEEVYNYQDNGDESREFEMMD